MNRNRASSTPGIALLALGIALGASTQAKAHEQHHHDHEEHHHDHGYGHEPGAHVHGQATMQLGLEGYRAEVIFDSPAANIIGFERAPRNEEEEAALQAAAEHFRSQPLVQPHLQGAACQLENAEVHSALLHDNGEVSEQGHAEFNVTQELACSVELSGVAIQAAVLKTYSGIERLRLEWISETGQGATELAPEQSVFRTQ